MVQPLWRIVWRFLKKKKKANKLGISLPYDPEILHLGVYPERAIIQKYAYTPMFISVMFTIARIWKQLKCLSTEEWIKMW